MLLVLIVYGISIRLKEYVINRSMWHDEAALALNVINKDILQLITQPLDHGQAAPIGFLFFTKLLAIIFGSSELVLRLIPFSTSIISFILFFLLLRQYVNKKYIPIALALFSTSTVLLRYSTEFKQYSSDVLFTLVILFFGMSIISKKFVVLRAFQLGAIGAIAVWFSFPSVFMLGGIGTSLLTMLLSKKRWEEVKNLCISFAFWGLSFGVIYFISLQQIGSDSSLENYWLQRFMPFPPYSLRDQLWVFNSFVEMLYYPGAIQQAFFGAIAFILGCYSFLRKDKTVLMMLLLPLFLTMLASGIHKYPFGGRLLLFYVPISYLLVSEGLVFLIRKSSYFYKIFGYVLLIIILWNPLTIAPKHLSYRMFYSEEIKPVLKYVQKHIKEKDIVYVYYGAKCAFNYYEKSYGLDKFDSVKGINSRKNWTKYKEDLSKLKGQEKVWIIFAHAQYKNKGEGEKAFIINYLETIGTRLDAIVSIRASAYLYKLNDD